MGKEEEEEKEEEGATDDEELKEMLTEELEKRVQQENQLDLTAYEGDEQNQARLMRHWQQEASLAAAVRRRQQQQQEAAEEAFSRQQQRRRSDPFAAYNLVTSRQQRQHRPLFSALDSPLGGWVSKPRRRRLAQPWTTSGFGGLASPMMLF